MEWTIRNYYKLFYANKSYNLDEAEKFPEKQNLPKWTKDEKYT